MKTSILAPSVLAVLTAISVGGCFVEAEAEPAVPEAQAVEPVEAVGDYRPMLYQGYVVYYDDYARPYYYVRGAPYYVPRAYVHYGTLVGHYYRYRAAYPHWVARYGVRYRVYRYHR